MSPSRNTTRTRVSLATGAGEQSSPLGLVGSIVLHAALIATAFFTWEHRLDFVSESTPIVPVDLVTIAKETNVAPSVIEPKEKPPEPVPQTQPENLIPPPPIPAEPAPAVEKAPVLPLMKPPPVPQAKPVPKPPAKSQSLADLLNGIEKNLDTKAKPQRARQDTVAHQGAGQQTAMTADLQTMLLNEIRRCWSPPVGAPNAAELIVRYDLFLNPDGSIAQPPQLDARSAAAKRAGDYYVAAADFAATRAIYACAPYKLPIDRYAQWREINPFIFDPTQMMGQ